MLVDLCQLDTNLDMPGNPNWRTAYIRLTQGYGLYYWPTREGPAPCGLCHPWAGSPELYKKAGWVSYEEWSSKQHLSLASPSVSTPQFLPFTVDYKLEAEINLFLPSGFWSWFLSLEIKLKEIIFYFIKHFKDVFFIRRYNYCNHSFIMLKQKSWSASIFCTLVPVLTFLVRQLASPGSKLVSPWTHEETDTLRKEAIEMEPPTLWLHFTPVL